MNNFEAYVLYLALKRHFTDAKYDFFKYRGKIKVSPKNLESRLDYYLIKRLARHPNPQGYLIANFLDAYNGNCSLFSMTDEIYDEWNNIQQSLMYRFKQDLAELDDDYLYTVMMNYNDHPYLIERYLQGQMLLESIIIMDRCRSTPTNVCRNFTLSWDKTFGEDIVWKRLSFKIDKYAPFVQFDHQQAQQLMSNKFQIPC